MVLPDSRRVADSEEGYALKACSVARFVSGARRPALSTGLTLALLTTGTALQLA